MPLQKLVDFLNELERLGLYYTVTSVRSDAVMVDVSKPLTGMRYEVEFFTNGQILAEIYQSHGTVANDEALQRVLS